MRKKIFISVIILMGMALVGIILTQLYLISKTVQDKQDQFRLNTNQIIKTVANNIQQRELRDFVDVMIDTTSSHPKTKILSGMRIMHINEENNINFSYSNDIVEKDFGKSNKYKNVNIKRLISRRVFSGSSINKNVDKKNNTSSEYRFQRIGHINEIDKALFYTTYKDIADRLPLEYRVSKLELEIKLRKELKQRDLDVGFEYAIYKNDSITDIRSDSFKLDKNHKDNFQTPFLPNNEGYTPYKLVVFFPNKNVYLLSSVLLMAILSGIFTLAIIGAYGFTLYQSIYQRRASRIKTDFINNMTHEFKTPIATISIALDALKSKKILTSPEYQAKYLNVITEENKRMHAQVEHILKISKFQKGGTKISLSPSLIEPIIDSAVGHIKLIAESKNGYIKTHYSNTEKTKVNLNKDYLTPALVNILDNAIKYSPKTIAIDIFTEVKEGILIIKISDKGMGMSKSTQAKVFQKFFREQTGDIHNVKGHGLGLAYVKYVIEAHYGEVTVESKEGKGSSFIISLSLA